MLVIFRSLLFTTLFCVLFLTTWFIERHIPIFYRSLAHGILGTIIILLITHVFIQQKKIGWHEIGFIRQLNIGQLVLYFLLGMFIMGSLALIVIFFSGYSLEWNKTFNPFSSCYFFLTLCVLAFFEECAFRGFIFFDLKHEFNGLVAIVWSSLLFGAYHLINGWGLQQAFLGAGVCGLIFGFFRFHSGSIWVSTSIHVGFNYVTSLFNTDAITDKSCFNVIINQNSIYIPEIIPQLIMLLVGISLLFCQKKKE